jgi:glutamate-5-semialdehyde dehydrogenase
MELVARARELATRARDASAAVASADTAKKNAVLLSIAEALEGDARARILSANAQDLEAGRAGGLSAALLDRLTLNDKGLTNLARAVREVAALPDPVGELLEVTTQKSGIEVGRMRVPLGVILLVYESRPNVTIDAAVLCLKAGNAVVLRGGREAAHTNRALADVITHALLAHGLPAGAAVFVDDPDRELLHALVQQVGLIDLAIPRGGTGLIDAVNAHARIPVIQHYQGICHVYVNEKADLARAQHIVVNAKVQRPGVCNAMECLVVDASVAAQALPPIADALRSHGVELRADARARAILGERAAAATEEDFDTEFLALTCAIKVVDGFDDALAFLRAHGSRHTEAIVTEDRALALRFLREVDASCVVWNASTRFNDGGELGLGAELGISTTKMHAYGPMGLQELCAKKFVVLGHGETRGSPP